MEILKWRIIAISISRRTTFSELLLLLNKENQNRERSTHSPMFFKLSVLKNFANFTGKHLRACNLIIKETPKQVFSCEIYENFLEHLFLQNTSLREKCPNTEIFWTLFTQYLSWLLPADIYDNMADIHDSFWQYLLLFLTIFYIFAVVL